MRSEAVKKILDVAVDTMIIMFRVVYAKGPSDKQPIDDSKSDLLAKMQKNRHLLSPEFLDLALGVLREIGVEAEGHQRDPDCLEIFSSLSACARKDLHIDALSDDANEKLSGALNRWGR